MVKQGIDWAVVPFRKSSYSTAQGGNCVEITYVPAVAVGIRDSKMGLSGPVLEFAPAGAGAFVRAVRSGRLGSATS